MDAKKELRLSPGDPNSYSRPDQVKVVDIFLNLDIDFEKHILRGHTVLTVERVDPSSKTLILDTKSLNITHIVNDKDGSKLSYNIGKPGYVGSKLEIDLPASSAQNTYKIKISYETTKECTAILWLRPEQTAGKTHPYLFSQCQAILCRTMVPCQDTPSVKSPFSAEVTAPGDLTVLMGAVRQGEPEKMDNGKQLHKFVQKIAVPSYLIAIAVGKLESRKIGPRTHVWSEGSIVDLAAADFSETEVMLKTAEELCGPYVWGTYDILVLPPSFAYGGMENPCLTFVSPTLLSGDKSQANVIAHEIAHSWSGNLITNSNFEHFWLNEGLTMFIERKILGRMESESARHFMAMEGWKALHYTVMEVLGESNPLTSLVIDLSGVDPDESYNSVPYEKGFAFLWYLEEVVGSPEVFEEFLKMYFANFKFKSLNSNQFKEYFLNYFKDKKDISQIPWDDCYFKTGMPVHKPNYDQTMAKGCIALKDKWISWDESTDCPLDDSEFQAFKPFQKDFFLLQLLDENPLSISKIEAMSKLYEMNSVKNCDLKFRWIRLGIKAKWQKIIPLAVSMVTEQGRMKYLRPIYRDLYNWEETRDLALKTFEENRKYLMDVAVQSLLKDLKLRG